MKRFPQMGAIALVALATVACEQATEPALDFSAGPSFALVSGPVRWAKRSWYAR